MNTTPLRFVSSSARAAAGLLALLISVTLLGAMGGIADHQVDGLQMAQAAQAESAQASVAAPASNG